MRDITITKTLYKYHELSERAKQNVIQLFYDIIESFQIKDTLMTSIDNTIFENLDIIFSLSNCQGDGVRFKYAKINILEYLDINMPELKSSVKNAINAYVTIEIYNNYNRYTYVSKNDVHIDYRSKRDYKHLDILIQKIYNQLITYYLDTCKMLENVGYDEIDYLISEDYILICDHEYDENGNIY